MWPAGAEHPMGMGRGPRAAPAPARSSSTATTTHSAWQSPVPYLFGGLAAMLGLIALSLLALACSYWKLSGRFLDDDDGGDLERQAGAGARPCDGKAAVAGKAAAGEHWREHVVVIMAGDERPTFLATPASGRGAAPDADADDARGVAVVGVGCGSEDGDEGRCVECGARSRPARAADGELGRSDQSGVTVTASGSSSSVISER